MEYQGFKRGDYVSVMRESEVLCEGEIVAVFKDGVSIQSDDGLRPHTFRSTSIRLLYAGSQMELF
ncbi:hypothetical protein [Vagococcus fessus]|uniref:Uncharacterized protein n=1 Tax=Vagococcus fessus TaxID=120370 RepID=A0A430A5B3_9ENTE|nr:hypothetical protein [Vagococcus fessus]RSU01941.1 hypothetical protein CBF31_09240 [Vagococcus fessus]